MSELRKRSREILTLTRPAEPLKPALVAAKKPKKQKLKVSIQDWRPIGKGNLIGAATVIVKSLRLSDVGVFKGKRGIHCTLPARPEFSEGKPVLTEKGRPRYHRIISWASQELHDEFTQAVVDKLRKLGHLPALNEEGDPTLTSEVAPP